MRLIGGIGIGDMSRRSMNWLSLIMAMPALVGCGAPGARVALKVPSTPSGSSKSEFRVVAQADSFPGEGTRQQLRARIIANVRERLMSHRDIERDAARMVNEVAT